MSASADIEIAVVGMGVIGLSVARHLANKGHEVLVLDRSAAPGTGISARNSSVIHAGLYYPRGTLKASLCVEGRLMLYDYCQSRNITHRKCGKLVVANSQMDTERLRGLQQRALDNGLHDVAWLNNDDIQALEPALRANHALFSPSTGILDTHGFVMSLMWEAENQGATISLRTEVSAITPIESGVRLDFTDSRIPPIIARHVVNAAGLNAPALAATAGTAPRGLYAKGNYFSLKRDMPFSHLIYPLPQQNGLGIHLTLDLAGRARFGPDVEWVETQDYTVSPERAGLFYEAIRSYWPDLPDDSLVPDYTKSH